MWSLENASFGTRSAGSHRAWRLPELQWQFDATATSDRRRSGSAGHDGGAKLANRRLLKRVGPALLI
jgi:hypothetical protein